MEEVREIQQAAADAERWIEGLTKRMGWHNRQKAYLALTATLHAFRDYLPADEATYLAAQLPILLRGVYYDGWHPAGHPLPIQDRGEFFDRIHLGVHRDPAIDPDFVARSVFAELASRLPQGELDDVKAATPQALRALWPS